MIIPGKNSNVNVQFFDMDEATTNTNNLLNSTHAAILDPRFSNNNRKQPIRTPREAYRQYKSQLFR